MVTSYTQLLSHSDIGASSIIKPINSLLITLEGAQRMRSLLGELREYWSVNERLAAIFNRIPDQVLKEYRERDFLSHDGWQGIVVYGRAAFFNGNMVRSRPGKARPQGLEHSRGLVILP
jgi:hypothetical protein